MSMLMREADLQMAEEIAMNAKVQRPAVCNAMETLLVDQRIAAAFLPVIARKLAEKNVELRADAPPRKLAQLRTSTTKDETQGRHRTGLLYRVQRLHPERARRGRCQQAIEHINRYGSAHSDSIVTRNEKHREAIPQRG